LFIRKYVKKIIFCIIRTTIKFIEFEFYWKIIYYSNNNINILLNIT